MWLQENTLFADRYQLVRLLGRGGFSEVWLAEDRLTGLKVAIKVYAPGTGLDSDGMSVFSKELSLVYNLDVYKRQGLFFPLERAQGDVRGIYRSFGRDFSCLLSTYRCV